MDWKDVQLLCPCPKAAPPCSWAHTPSTGDCPHHASFAGDPIAGCSRRSQGAVGREFVLRSPEDDKVGRYPECSPFSVLDPKCRGPSGSGTLCVTRLTNHQSRTCQWRLASPRRSAARHVTIIVSPNSCIPARSEEENSESRQYY